MIKPAAKSWIIIICTLIIGIAIGFEISEITIRPRFEELRGVRAPKGFVRVFGKMLNLNEKQKPVIDSILVKYYNRIDVVSKSNMSLIAGIIDSMKSEMKTKLTPEQIKRLDREMMGLRSPGSPAFSDRPLNRRRPMPPQVQRSPGDRRDAPGERRSSPR